MAQGGSSVPSRQLSLKEMFDTGQDGGADRENNDENVAVEVEDWLDQPERDGALGGGRGHLERGETEDETRSRDVQAVPSTSYAGLGAQRGRNLVSAILDRAVHSRFCPWSERVLRGKEMAMYAGGSCKTPLRLCGSLGLRRPTLAAEVDGIGELLVVGCGGGHVLVNDIQGILDAAADAVGEARGDGGEGDDGEGGEGGDEGRRRRVGSGRHVGERIVEPGLHVRVGDGDSDSSVHAVRWNPVNQNEIAVLSSKSIATYDINRTRGEPSTSIPLQQSKAMDAVYFPRSSSTGSGQYCVAVACDRHGVLLYDARSNRNARGGKPVCVLKGDTPRHTGARCVSIVDDGRIVLAGGGRDLDGYVNMWDLRSVSGNVAVTLSAAPNKHQHLRRVCLRTQLGRIDGLIDQCGLIPSTYPEFFLPDPASYHRVGFNMRCGWSAVLDLGRLELSHVHAPPARHGSFGESWMNAMDELMEEARMARMARVAGDGGRVALPHETVASGVPDPEWSWGNVNARGKRVVGGCWLGESFVVPSAATEGMVQIVDFSGPARADGQYDADGMDEAGSELDAPSTIQVGVSHDAVGVVRVPGDRGAFAGGAPTLLSYGTDGTWNVISREYRC